MAIKGYSTFLKAPRVESHDLMWFSVMTRILIGRVWPSLQRCSYYILQPLLTVQLPVRWQGWKEWKERRIESTFGMKFIYTSVQEFLFFPPFGERELMKKLSFWMSILWYLSSPYVFTNKLTYSGLSLHIIDVSEITTTCW